VSASPGAPWNRYVTPGDELNVIEAVLLFDFECLILIRCQDCRPGLGGGRDTQRAALYTRLAYLRGEE
jgi:hypothetical protein